MSAAGAKAGQRLLNTNSDAYGTTFGPVNAAYWKVYISLCLCLCLSLSLSRARQLAALRR